MKDVTVGYFNLLGETFISGIEINKNFLNLLRHYVKVTVIPIAKAEEIENSFRKIEKYKLDYLYINSFNFLLPSFLLREKLGLDIAFILKIHTVFNWVHRYIYITPLIRKYDIIFAPSNYTKESFLRISDKFDVQVIPNFLDIKYIQKNLSYNFKEQKKIITFMGRLTEEKGIGTLMKCMPKIMSKVDNLHLNVIGPLSGENIADYPQNPYVGKLKKEVKRLKLTHRFHFKGARFGLDKYKILSESDIFVSPTTALEENFPVANIEALACGVPVIATNWAGNKELIRDGKNGFLIDINYEQNKRPEINRKQLISTIVKTLKNKQLSYKIRRNALVSARYYDYHRVLPRLVSLLKKRIKTKVKSNWDLIKDKTLIDFRDIFNKDFFFFINIDNALRKKTYSSLYKETIQQMFSKKRIYPNNIRRGFRKPRHTKIIKRLRQNLLDFLLLKDT